MNIKVNIHKTEYTVLWILTFILVCCNFWTLMLVIKLRNSHGRLSRFLKGRCLVKRRLRCFIQSKARRIECLSVSSRIVNSCFETTIMPYCAYQLLLVGPGGQSWPSLGGGILSFDSHSQHTTCYPYHHGKLFYALVATLCYNLPCPHGSRMDQMLSVAVEEYISKQHPQKLTIQRRLANVRLVHQLESDYRKRTYSCFECKFRWQIIGRACCPFGCHFEPLPCSVDQP